MSDGVKVAAALIRISCCIGAGFAFGAWQGSFNAGLFAALALLAVAP